MILNVRDAVTNAPVCTLPCKSASAVRWDMVLVDGRLIEWAFPVVVETIEDEEERKEKRK